MRITPPFGRPANLSVLGTTMSRMSESVTAPPPGVPEDHPAHILADPDDEHDYPHIEIEMCSGPRAEGIAGLRYWWATATVTNHATPPMNIPVARMSLTVVNEFLCDPVYALDAIDSDSLVMGDALWRKGQRRPEFEDVAPDNWGPVAIINSYEVEPDWRRTPLSPMIALRFLAVLAELDLSAAALYAAPYNSSIDGPERDAASAKIAAMWERAGFARLRPDAAPGTDQSHIMVRALDPNEIDTHIETLAGTDPILREAVE